MLEKLTELVEKYPNLAQEVYPIIIGACILVWLFITSILVIDSIQKRNKKKKMVRRGRKCYKNI